MAAGVSVFPWKNSLAIILASIMIALCGFSIASAQTKDDLCRGSHLTFNKTGTGGNINCGTDAQGNPIAAGTGPQSDFNRLLTTVINVFSVVVGIIAVVMIIVGGFKFIVSGGDSAKVTSARNTIIYAIIGLIIVALAQTIAKFVLSNVPA
jgi:hypothetical protein